MKQITIAFRLTFVIAIILISFLAFSNMEESPVAAINDKLMHVTAFVALAFLLDFSWPREAFIAEKYLPLLAYGLFIELVQWGLPYREFSLLDLLADALGLLVYFGCFPLIRQLPILARRWS
jgi:VanZ family protein